MNHQKHPDFFQQYNVILANKSKNPARKRVRNQEVAKIRQTQIDFPTLKQRKVLPKSEQDKFDEAVVNFIVATAQPRSIVDDSNFIHLMKELKFYVSESSSIQLEKQKFNFVVISILRPVKYIFLTGDLWSASHRSYLEMTATLDQRRNLSQRIRCVEQ